MKDEMVFLSSLVSLTTGFPTPGWGATGSWRDRGSVYTHIHRPEDPEASLQISEDQA